MSEPDNNGSPGNPLDNSFRLCQAYAETLGIIQERVRQVNRREPSVGRQQVDELKDQLANADGEFNRTIARASNYKDLEDLPQAVQKEVSKLRDRFCFIAFDLLDTLDGELVEAGVRNACEENELILKAMQEEARVQRGPQEALHSRVNSQLEAFVRDIFDYIPQDRKTRSYYNRKGTPPRWDSRHISELIPEELGRRAEDIRYQYSELADKLAERAARKAAKLSTKTASIVNSEVSAGPQAKTQSIAARAEQRATSEVADSAIQGESSPLPNKRIDRRPLKDVLADATRQLGNTVKGGAKSATQRLSGHGRTGRNR
jgi:hypothetical protein